MRRLVSNANPVGQDICLTPLEVEVPMIIVDNGNGCFWYPETMDRSSADRMAFAIMNSSSHAFRVDVKIVLPAATAIRAATADLDELACVPARILFRANG